MSKQLERIENYLSGQMNTAERNDFEEDLRRDPDLKKTFDQLKVINDVFEVEVEDSLRDHLNELARQNNIIASTQSMSRTYTMAIAASLLILLVAGTWWYLDRSRIDPSQYAVAQYIEYNGTNLRAEENSNPYASAYTLLGQEDTSAAIVWLDQWIANQPEDLEATFFLADLLYKSGSWQRANALFLSVARSQSVLWGEKSEWNYLMNSLQQHHWDDDAKAIIQRIKKNKNHSFHDQALTLEKMKK
jgi:TolA-binding protein